MRWIHRGISNGTSQPARPSSDQSADERVTSDCHTSAVPTRLSPRVVIDACKSTFSYKTHIATCISPLDTCVCVCMHAYMQKPLQITCNVSTYLPIIFYISETGRQKGKAHAGRYERCMFMSHVFRTNFPARLKLSILANICCIQPHLD